MTISRQGIMIITLAIYLSGQAGWRLPTCLFSLELSLSTSSYFLNIEKVDMVDGETMWNHRLKWCVMASDVTMKHSLEKQFLKLFVDDE